jgi:regulator of cell morphogenesis and NO signaling
MIGTYAEATLAELVTERPSRARLFEDLGLDYCCHGGRTLAESCRESKVPLAQVIERLSEADRTHQGGQEPDWTAAPLAELISHIVSVHHRYLKRELPRLAMLLDRVAAAHSASHPELVEAQHVLAGLTQELSSHMGKEENVLFPWIVLLESPDSPTVPRGSVANPIHVMEHEHRDAGEALRRLRELTGDYRVPADGCTSYLALLHGLMELEHDLHLHIHKENNILFPRAAALEAMR